MAAKKKIAVIGGGMSGLVSIKSCLEEGLQPTCYEQHDQLGGTWYYSDEPRPDQGSPSYYNLVTNTSSYMLGFSDYPMDLDKYPIFMRKELYHNYFKDYANHFKLKEYISFHTKVEKVEKMPDYKETGRWKVSWKRTNGVTGSDIFDAVMVCSGPFRKPVYPNTAGLEKWKRDKLHTHYYRRPEKYTGKTILVMGNQNSAAEVAMDVAQTAKKVYLSLGDKGARLLSRFTYGGQPIELNFSRSFFNRPTHKIKRDIKEWALRGLNHEQYGLHSCNRTLDKQVRRMVSDGLQYHLITGKVKTKKLAVEFGETWVRFSDGSILDDVDLIIFATGYQPDYSFVDCPCIEGPDRLKWNIYQWTWPLGELAHNTLAIISCIGQYAGPLSGTAELQARWATLVFSGQLKLPHVDKMVQYRIKEIEYIKREYEGKAAIDYYPAMDTLADSVGVRPNLWRIFFQNPCLAYLLYYGPNIPQAFSVI